MIFVAFVRRPPCIPYSRSSVGSFLNNKKFFSTGGPGSPESGEPRSIFGDVARIVAYAGVGLTLSLIVKELNNGQSISFPFQSNKDDGERKTTKESSINVDILEPQGFVTERVYFDVSIGGGPSERLVIGLYGEDCPLTVTNFSRLCEGFDVSGRKLHYQNSFIHRIIPSFMAQGGDFTRFDGTGGESERYLMDSIPQWHLFSNDQPYTMHYLPGIFGKPFKDESFKFKHDRIGVLSMANRGKDTNSSQFFLCFGPAPWLDGRHVVFGNLIFGAETLRKIENQGSRSGKVSGEVKIVSCGRLPRLEDSIAANRPEKEELDSDGRARDRIMK